MRPWRGSAQRKVHEERFAARNTFRREFGLLLPFVPAESVLAGNEFFSCKEALPALTLSFRARMQELSAFRSSKTGGRGLVEAEADLSSRPPTCPRSIQGRL